HGDIQVQSIGQMGFEHSIPRKNFGVESGQGNVVVSQTNAAIGRKEGVGCLVEFGIEIVRLFDCCHVGQCPSRHLFGKWKYSQRSSNEPEATNDHRGGSTRSHKTSVHFKAVRRV